MGERFSWLLVLMLILWAVPAFTNLTRQFTSFYVPEIKIRKKSELLNRYLSKPTLSSRSADQITDAHEIRVREIFIVDSNDNVIGRIGAHKNGAGGAIELFNAEGAPNVMLGSLPEQNEGYVSTFASSGELTTYAGTDASGTIGDGAIAVYSQRSEGETIIGTDALGDPVIGLLNRAGTVVAFAAADSAGNGTLAVLSDGGLPLASMGMNEEGTAGDVKTFTTEGEVKWGSDQMTSDVVGDLDGDGDVDFSDFVIFARNFGSGEGHGGSRNR